MNGIEFNLTWVGVLTLVVSIVLPLLVGLVTTRLTESWKRGVLLAFLAALVGFLSELLEALTTSTAFDAGTALLTWLGSFLVAVGMYFGLWRTGPAQAAQDVQVTTLIGPKHRAEG